MKTANNLPISGVIESLSIPVGYVEPGMFFSFNGQELKIFSSDLLDDNQLMDIIFSEVESASSSGNMIIQGSVRPSGERVVFHVSCCPGIKNRGIYFSVIAYWIIESNYELKDLSVIRFAGLCVESFCPMTNVHRNTHEDCSEIIARTSSENTIDLGIAFIDKCEIAIFATHTGIISSVNT